MSVKRCEVECVNFVNLLRGEGMLVVVVNGLRFGDRFTRARNRKARSPQSNTSYNPRVVAGNHFFSVGRNGFANYVKLNRFFWNSHLARNSDARLCWGGQHIGGWIVNQGMELHERWVRKVGIWR
jgi:hypothetical protein